MKIEISKTQYLPIVTVRGYKGEQWQYELSPWTASLGDAQARVEREREECEGNLESSYMEIKESIEVVEISESQEKIMMALGNRPQNRFAREEWDRLQRDCVDTKWGKVFRLRKSAGSRTASALDAKGICKRITSMQYQIDYGVRLADGVTIAQEVAK